MFKGLPNRLYRNKGDGTFEDVSAKAGLLAHVGKGMSAAVADFNHDGRLDVFVTNDTVPNFLFKNKAMARSPKLRCSPASRSPDSGRPISSMGTDFQDYDNDGLDDIHLTALSGETFPLFRNDSHGGFIEDDAGERPRPAHRRSCQAGARSSPTWTTTAGRTSSPRTRTSTTASATFRRSAGKQPNALFVNDGRGHFSDASDAAGFGAAAAAHRGCGVADFDGDGRLDIVVLALGTPAELWQNTSAPARTTG